MKSIASAQSHVVPEKKFCGKQVYKQCRFVRNVSFWISRPHSQELKSAKTSEMFIDYWQRRIAALERQNITDELTGHLNHHGFYTQLQRSLFGDDRYIERGLDAFKPISESYGHAPDDEVLRHVKNPLNDGIRNTNILARMSGDKFSILLSHSNRKNSLKHPARIEIRLKKPTRHWQDQIIAISASFDLQAYGPKEQNGDFLVRAGEAFCETKRHHTHQGRLRVSFCIWERRVRRRYPTPRVYAIP